MKNIKIPGLRNARSILQVWGIVLALVLLGWLFLKFWQYFTLLGIIATAYYLHGKKTAVIRLADGVTLNPEALANYITRLIRDEDGDLDPDLSLSGWGSGLKVNLKVEFPDEPEKAADFHSRIIYLKGYISRKLYDDFRIRNAQVEIEAVQGGLVSSRPGGLIQNEPV